MTAFNITPTTLTGFRRLARKIARDEGLSHARAADISARRGGFNNWKDLIRRHGDDDVVQGHVVFLTAYWRGPDRSRGRETLCIRLSRPLDDLVTPTHLKLLRQMAMRREAPDHLVQPEDANSARRAQKDILHAVRVLRFMDATGLKPARGHGRSYPRGLSENGPPGKDHTSPWYDPASREHLLIDEPYGPRFSDDDARAQWGVRHGWRSVRSSWPGMWNPTGGTEMWLTFAVRGRLQVDRILEGLDLLSREAMTETWTGDSGDYAPAWVSSLGHALGLRPRSRFAPPTPPGAVRIGGSQLVAFHKPAGHMPVPQHAEVGRRLKRVLRAPDLPWKAYDAINGLRSELDDWAANEHRDLANDEFLALYYREDGPRGPSVKVAASAYVAELEAAKGTLAAHYRDSAPLRSWTRKADKLIAVLNEA